MKKIHPTLISLALCLSLLSGCSLSTLHYNNKIVEQMKLTSTAVDKSSSTYNTLLPDTITEKTSINTQALTEQFDSIEENIKDAQKLTKYESQNLDQQSLITPLLEAYLNSAQNYENAYQDMLTYYAEDEYKTNITKVETIDEALYESYANFAEANNDLAEALESFVE